MALQHSRRRPGGIVSATSFGGGACPRTPSIRQLACPRSHAPGVPSTATMAPAVGVSSSTSVFAIGLAVAVYCVLVERFQITECSLRHRRSRGLPRGPHADGHQPSPRGISLRSTPSSSATSSGCGSSRSSRRDMRNRSPTSRTPSSASRLAPTNSRRGPNRSGPCLKWRLRIRRPG